MVEVEAEVADLHPILQFQFLHDRLRCLRRQGGLPHACQHRWNSHRLLLLLLLLLCRLFSRYRHPRGRRRSCRKLPRLRKACEPTWKRVLVRSSQHPIMPHLLVYWLVVVLLLQLLLPLLLLLSQAQLHCRQAAVLPPLVRPLGSVTAALLVQVPRTRAKAWKWW